LHGIVLKKIGIFTLMAKRKTKNSKNKTKLLKYGVWLFALLSFALMFLAVGYYYGYLDAKKKFQHCVSQSVSQTKHKKKTSQKHKIKRYISASHEYKDEHLAKPPKAPKRRVVKTTAKPKLAIIIDDISLASQIKRLKSIGLPLTLSFFPPKATRPNSAKLASHEKVYMVHLPMEAYNFTAEEPLTLRVNDSQKVISDRIKEIKRLFPRVRYINNHTGSKFTADEIAVNRLILALKNQHINFIDSRTTAQTKVPKVMKNYGFKYVARDVFLDDDTDIDEIVFQIKRAIKLAKLHGSAIAIGHPHPNTIKALKISKKLFKDVELVRINRLY